MHHFFVKKEQINERTIRIAGNDVHHLRDVLRIRKGERILVSDGDAWEYTCEVDEIGAEEAVATILDTQKAAKELPSRILLLQCLPKGDKMETVIQKAVELGASDIVPVAASRCVVRLDAKKAETKLRRWNAIAESAAKQAKRIKIPTVHPLCDYEEALQRIQTATERKTPEGEKNDMPVLLLPYERAEGMQETRKILEQIPIGRPIVVLIGPEGGFSEEEVCLAVQTGFQPITLGARILRTETAGMAILSVLAYLLESNADKERRD